ncbi:MAG: MFS transporter, partial [Acidimicrobiales bacterium]
MTSNDRRPAVFAVAQNQSSIESDEPQQRLMTPHFGILCLSALFSALGFSSVIPTVARFVVTDLNGGDVEVGLALGVFSFSAVLARPWIGRLGDRRGRRLLIAGGSFITAGVLAAHAFADSYSTLLIARLLMGAVQGAFFVGTVTLTTDLAPEHRRGEAASYFSVAIYGGMAFGPWLGEWAVGRWGFDGGFMVGGLWMGLAAIVACWLPDFVGSQPAQVLTTKQPTQSSLLYRAAIWPGIVMALGIMIFPALHGFMPKVMDERALGEAGPIY